MCQKCAKKMKNYGYRTKVPKRILRRYARLFDKGYAIPLFKDRKSNYYIEAWVHWNHLNKTKRTKYQEMENPRDMR